MPWAGTGPPRPAVGLFSWAAVRRHAITQQNQCRNDMLARDCRTYGVELVFTSAHYGARPSHAAWQGKPYGLDGPCEVDGVKYPGLAEATGYGTVAGLCGANCRHRIHPYVPGLTKLPDTDFEAFEAKYHMTSDEYYEATQRQRALERQIRQTKREIALGEAHGADMTEDRYRLGAQQRRLREHCARTGLPRQRGREQAYAVADKDGTGVSIFRQPRALNPQSRAAIAKREAEEMALKARMSDYFDDHFSGDYVTSARRSYASSKDVLSKLQQRTGVDFEIDQRWFTSLPKEQQRAIAVGIDYGMEVVGTPSRQLLALRTYSGEPDEYARHQRREAGYIVELNASVLSGMSPDQVEQVVLHEIAHSAESAATSWAEHCIERDALLGWTPFATELPQSRASGIMEEALRAAGFGEEVEYNGMEGRLMLHGDLRAYAESVSTYAVRGADPGAQDNELNAECIRFIANNGFGENPVADAIARRFL